jgi:hypothetical protein
MRLILSFILLFSLLLNQLNAQVQGEKQPADTVQGRFKEAPKPKVPASFYIPTGIRLGTDLVALGISAFGGDRKRYEFEADIDFHNFYLAGSYGVASYELVEPTFNYSNEGTFYRIGIDANFLKTDPDLNTLTFGLRYGRASFSENLVNSNTDRFFGAYSDEVSNTGVTSRWFELTTGLRIRMIENLYLGYNFRVQVLKKSSPTQQFRTYDVPGFGRNQFNSSWAFNYYVVYRISWKEKNLIIPSK